jgi:hypothetical protein
MQSWIVERMAEEHRRDLIALIRTESQSSFELGDQAPAAPRLLVAGPPAAGRMTQHRPIGRQVGALLIRAGTRLGGASISPS